MLENLKLVSNIYFENYIISGKILVSLEFGI